MSDPEMTQAAAAAKAVNIKDILGRIKPARWTARIPLRGDLLPEMNDLYAKIQAVRDGDSDDEAVGDDGLAGMVRRYNELSAQFSGEHLEVTFRPNTASDYLAAIEACKADGRDPEKLPLAEFWPYQWAEQCVEPKMTAADFMELRAALGDAALLQMHERFEQANNGAATTAPFSPLPLPGRTKRKRSES